MAVEALRRREVPTETVIERLKARFGERLSTATAVRDQHGKDESYHAIERARRGGLRPLDRGSGRDRQVCAPSTRCRSFPSAPAPRSKAMSRRSRRRLHRRRPDEPGAARQSPRTSTARSQAGVTRKQLNEYLRDTGLFFPIDPGADASIGGMAATRASGTNAVRYGTMRDNVLSLTVVLADGRVITHRQPGAQIVGRLRPDPAVRRLRGHAGRHHRSDAPALRHSRSDRRRRSAPSRTIAAAVDTAIIRPSRPASRSRGSNCWTRCRSTPSTAIRSSIIQVAPTLFFEFHGTEAGVQEQAEMVQAIAERPWRRRFPLDDQSAEERTKLWQARHDAYYAGMALRPGSQGLGDRRLRADLAPGRVHRTRPRRTWTTSILPVRIVGHVGDGNFHLTASCSIRTSRKNSRRPSEINERMVQAGAGARRHLHRRARRRLRQDRAASRKSTARRDQRHARRSSARSTRIT